MPAMIQENWPLPLLVEHLDGIERRLRRDADDVRAFDRGGDRPGTVRAVALIVHGRGDARDEARAADVVRLEVRVVEVDAGVDDRDPYPLALGIAPGLRGVHLLDAGGDGLRERGRLVFDGQVAERPCPFTQGVARGIVLDHRYVVVLPQGVDFALGQLRGHDGDLVLIHVVADQLRFKRRTRGPMGSVVASKKCGCTPCVSALRTISTLSVVRSGRWSLRLNVTMTDRRSVVVVAESTLCHIPSPLQNAWT